MKCLQKQSAIPLHYAVEPLHSGHDWDPAGIGGEHSRMIVFLKCLPNYFCHYSFARTWERCSTQRFVRKVRTDQGVENVEMWRVKEAIHGGPPLLLSLVAPLIMKDLKECGMMFSSQQCRNSITFLRNGVMQHDKSAQWNKHLLPSLHFLSQESAAF